MTTVLDNLMGANEMLPTIVAFIGSVDRDGEFAANPLYAQYLTSEVIKHIEALQCSQNPDKRAIMGVGLGAVMALYTTWRHPGKIRTGVDAIWSVSLHRCWRPWIGSRLGWISRIRQQHS